MLRTMHVLENVNAAKRLMICSSQTVRLVNHCFTNRASRAGCAGRGLVDTLKSLY